MAYSEGYILHNDGYGRHWAAVLHVYVQNTGSGSKGVSIKILILPTNLGRDRNIESATYINYFFIYITQHYRIISNAL